MCGIAGFLPSKNNFPKKEIKAIASAMAKTLAHRGPDDQGIWVDSDQNVALIHRRLSILDLSVAGHQPMISSSSRFVIVLNGEIYNFKELREELVKQNFTFKGSSDTEIVLAAFEHWGVKEAVKHFNGMFAFAVWDCKEKFLYLCRDRLGEKPFYYGFIKDSFVFASELKPFLEFPGFEKEIDRQALTLYLRYNDVPAPYSIYRNIKKVLPGEIITFNLRNSNYISDFYWSAQDICKKANSVVWNKNFNETVSDFEKLLLDAVKIRMESDVPLGVFLSGGIDSSLITALMQVNSTKPIKTFTIGFEDPRYDEATEAQNIAKYLGTAHTSLYTTGQDALNLIPTLPSVYDEPFSDSSQIPTLLVCKMARKHVTVCLSGDGGDEIFAGYNRYIWLENIWKKVQLLPLGIRKPIANLFSVCPPDCFEAGFNKIAFMLPKKLQQRNPAIKFQKFIDVLKSQDVHMAYLNLISHWKNPEKIVLGQTDCTIGKKINDELQFNDLKRKMMYSDMINYLPNDIMVKVDRASMSVGLESRAVYLDHRLVELAWSLPVSMLIDNSGSKLILRQILKKYLPENYWNRPKMGFALPLDNWLRGPLKTWADDLLSSDYLKNKGFFDHKLVSKKWQEHKKGVRNWQYDLWDILMFNAWFEFYK